ncbi:MAG: hypothetical protein ACOYOV_18135 [Bacteroidales bacterium]
MKIENENGYVIYSIEDAEITIDDIKSFKQRQGTGKNLINKIKEIAIELNLPIGLYSYPQDDTIIQGDLNDFYYACGFELDKDDSDFRLFFWKP